MFFSKKNIRNLLKYQVLKINPLRAFYRWKKRRADGHFFEYYVEMEQEGLKRGIKHPSLGGNLKNHDFRDSGKDKFDWLVARGLKPTHICVDYGCGSLRIGQHLLRYLLPGHYYGLDVTDYFFTMGKELLPAALLREKSPNLQLIHPGNLKRIQDRGVDYLISCGVLLHVPPFELDAFFSNILSLMGPKTQVYVELTAYKKNKQFSTVSWAYSKDYIHQRIRAIDNKITISFLDFHPFTKQTAIGRLKVQRGLIELRKS